MRFGVIGGLVAGVVVGVIAAHVDAALTADVVPWLGSRDPRSYPHVIEVILAGFLLFPWVWAYGEHKLGTFAERDCARAQKDRDEAISQRKEDAVASQRQAAEIARLTKSTDALVSEVQHLKDDVQVASVQRLKQYESALAGQILWQGALQDIREVLSTSPSEASRIVEMQRFVAYILYDVFTWIGGRIVRL